MILCTMKRQYIGLFIAILLIFSGCGTSRQIKSSSYPIVGESEIITEAPSEEKPSIAPPPSPITLLSPETTVAARLDSLLLTADSLLQTSQLGLHIVDLTTGKILYARNARHRMRPASTEKVVTAIAALDLLGPSYQLSTQLLTTAPVSGSTLQGDLYIKGVMDPLLTLTDIRQLASRLKATGIHTVTGYLIADASFKDSDEYGWGWCWDDDNPSLTPLLIGGKPGLTAALRTALKNAGITVKKGITSGTAPATARPLAVFNRPLTDVMQPMMKESDNLCAEAVFYQLKTDPSRHGGGQTYGKHYSRKQSAELINNLITRAYTPQEHPSMTIGGGVISTIADGSGLSLYNYQTPETFTRLLTYALARPDSIFQPLLAALPIAAVDGTLQKRMIDTPAAANVRAKTGSVSAVSTLVGYTTQRSTNHLIAFAIMNQGVQRMADGRNLQDKICILLSE